MTRCAAALAVTCALASPVAAPSPGGQVANAAGPGVTGAVELQAGYAGFVDDAMIDHAVLGGGARFYLTRRLSVGPEIVYMRGPGSDRDLFITGNVTYDFAGRGGRPARVTPFVIAGAGMMRHRSRFGPSTFASTEGAFTAGGGVRVRLRDRLLVGADARCGWELHCRIAGSLGVTFGR